MTQTTAVRVESILESHLHLIPLMVGVDGESADIGGMTEAAQKIAAEIDALTRERDEARAELAGLDAGMRFQFDRAEDYKAQRDEARAELLKEREAYSKRAAEQTVSGASKLMIAELAEARAEVERLRPAAEAWEARYRWGKTIDGTAESVKAQIAMEDAEDQAAAAKEAKP